MYSDAFSNLINGDLSRKVQSYSLWTGLPLLRIVQRCCKISHMHVTDITDTEFPRHARTSTISPPLSSSFRATALRLPSVYLAMISRAYSIQLCRRKRVLIQHAWLRTTTRQIHIWFKICVFDCRLSFPSFLTSVVFNHELYVPCARACARVRVTHAQIIMSLTATIYYNFHAFWNIKFMIILNLFMSVTFDRGNIFSQKLLKKLRNMSFLLNRYGDSAKKTNAHNCVLSVIINYFIEIN